MSTNKTPNYHLHAWEPGDDFLRAEMNENFAAIDAAVGDKVGAITGSYVGTSTTSTVRVELGFRPKALLIIRSNQWEGDSSDRYYALALPDKANPAVVFDSTGVTLSSSERQVLTYYQVTYHYMAFL